MEKKLQEHSLLIKSEIDNIRKQLGKTNKKEERAGISKKLKKLYKYHLEVVHNFQHERLIHLIVTLFFAFMTLFSVAGLFILSSSYSGGTYSIVPSLLIPALLLVLILLVVVGFYVRHYYQLENGTQKLYELSKEISDIEDGIDS